MKFRLYKGAMEHHFDPIKAGIDAAAAGTAVASVMGWLPAVAALVSIVWFGIQIFESKTSQYWVQRWRAWFEKRE